MAEFEGLLADYAATFTKNGGRATRHEIAARAALFTWARRALARVSEAPEGADSDLARMDRVANEWMDEAFAAGRRVDSLRARLARLLRVVQGLPYRMAWTDHNGGGTVWRLPFEWQPKTRGRVWSRKWSPGAGADESGEAPKR